MAPSRRTTSVDPAPPDLDRFFRPRRVAVVGASDRRGSPQRGAWSLLRRWAERRGAEIVPVNPHRASVDGLPCHPDLAAVPGEVDVVAVLVGAAEPVVAEAVRLGVRFVVVFSSGYAETGADGAAEQARLADLVAGSATRLLGPNTNLNSFEVFRDDLDGPAIAIISQSGHQGRPLFLLQELGIRVSHWAPTGNEADLGAADFVAWFASQPEVGVVAAYLEGLKDGPRFLEAADRALDAGTAVVAVKVGRTELGRSGVASHTGHLAGADRVADGAFRQHGIVRVDALDDLADTATLLARAGAPRAPGIAVYSISGGTAAHVADLLSSAGLSVPELSAQTQAALHQWIPDFLTVRNPVDCGGHPVGDARGRQILDAIVADPAVGALVCAVTAPFPPLSDRLAADLVDLAASTDVPICVIWGSPVGDEPALREVLHGSADVVVFRSARNGVDALARWQRWHAQRSQPRPAPRRRRSARAAPARRQVDQALADRAGAPGGVVALSEWEATALLRAYDVPVARSALVHSGEEAVAAAASSGGPVVLKACGPELLHKSELGLVLVGLSGARAVARGHRLLLDRAAAAGLALDGVLVAEQVRGGTELVAGITRDPVFGPVVMAGFGGVAVEVLPDVAFRVPPFDRREARRMLGDLRGAALLGSIRGAPPVDVDAVATVLARLSTMAFDLGDQLVELDVNPLLAHEGGCVALDALVTWRPSRRGRPG